MTDKELFQEVLKRVVERYELRVEYPYGDSYFELYDGDEQLMGMNPEGFSLLYNLKELSKVAEFVF